MRFYVGMRDRVWPIESEHLMKLRYRCRFLPFRFYQNVWNMHIKRKIMRAHKKKWTNWKSTELFGPSKKAKSYLNGCKSIDRPSIWRASHYFSGKHFIFRMVFVSVWPLFHFRWHVGMRAIACLVFFSSLLFSFPSFILLFGFHCLNCGTRPFHV